MSRGGGGGGIQPQGIITFHLLTVVVFVENMLTVVPIYTIYQVAILARTHLSYKAMLSEVRLCIA